MILKSEHVYLSWAFGSSLNPTFVRHIRCDVNKTSEKSNSFKFRWQQTHLNLCKSENRMFYTWFYMWKWWVHDEQLQSCGIRAINDLKIKLLPNVFPFNIKHKIYVMRVLNAKCWKYTAKCFTAFQKFCIKRAANSKEFNEILRHSKWTWQRQTKKKNERKKTNATNWQILSRK